jgi:hypothetical protein
MVRSRYIRLFVCCNSHKYITYVCLVGIESNIERVLFNFNWEGGNQRMVRTICEHEVVCSTHCWQFP